MDFVNGWSAKTEIPMACFIRWLRIGSSKFYEWRQRYGKVHEHNGWIPRDFWLEPWERQAIIDYFAEHPEEGYRRLTFLMLDEDVVAASPTTVWRVLHQAGLLRRWPCVAFRTREVLSLLQPQTSSQRFAEHDSGQLAQTELVEEKRARVLGALHSGLALRVVRLPADTAYAPRPQNAPCPSGLDQPQGLCYGGGASRLKSAVLLHLNLCRYLSKDGGKLRHKPKYLGNLA